MRNGSVHRKPLLYCMADRRRIDLIRAGVLSVTFTSHQGFASMAGIPDNFLDLLQQKKAFADLATVMADGSPQVTPVWFDYTGGVIRVNTAKGRVKSRTLRPGAPFAMAIRDPDNPYRYVQIRGRVRRASEQGADAHIDSLAKKYLDKDTYPFRQPGEVRVMYELEPTAASGMG
jgi:PPOX class probable F420-dependent enzyme